MLQHTGHGYWPVAIGVAGVALLAALAAAIRRGTDIAIRRRATVGTIDSVGQIGRLALWQMALFGVMESAERLSAGISPIALLHSRNFATGLGLQLILATAIVIGLRMVERVAERVTRVLSRAVVQGTLTFTVTLRFADGSTEDSQVPLTVTTGTPGTETPAAPRRRPPRPRGRRRLRSPPRRRLPMTTAAPTWRWVSPSPPRRSRSPASAAPSGAVPQRPHRHARVRISSGECDPDLASFADSERRDDDVGERVERSTGVRRVHHESDNCTRQERVQQCSCRIGEEQRVGERASSATLQQR